MNKYEVVFLYSPLLIKSWVQLFRNFIFFKYPANIHNVSLKKKTFVECIQSEILKYYSITQTHEVQPILTYEKLLHNIINETEITVSSFKSTTQFTLIIY